MLSDLIYKLETVNAQSESFASEFEDILAKIAKLNDSKCIEKLLPFFDDKAEYDEVMFSIVHIIESFDVRIYLRHLLQGLPNFWKKSPRWAMILHMRILNDSDSVTAYTDLIQDLPPREAASVRAVLEGVKQKRHEFGPQCNTLLGRL